MRYTTHSFVTGDARSLDMIGGGTADLIITSPPYPMIEMWDKGFVDLNPEIASYLKNDAGVHAWEAMHDLLMPAWKEVKRVLKEGGIVCINIGDATRTINGNFSLYPNHSRVIAAFTELGFQMLPSIIWRKQTNAPNKFMGSGMLAPGAYVTLEHEHILVFRKGGRRRFDNNEAKAVRAESAYFWEERNRWFSDVWTDLKGTRQELHRTSLRNRSAAYPFELAYRLVSMYSVKGDMIVDPFAGTGTTMLAAAAAERNSVSIDIEPGFAELATDHMKLLPGVANTVISDRLAKHTRFVRHHNSERGSSSLKYFNEHHGFAVKTRQERHLLLRHLRQIVVDGAMFRVVYDGTAVPSTEQGELELTAS